MSNLSTERSHLPLAQEGLRLAGITLRAFEIFAAVAERGSMTAAAEQLSVSQSAVSQAVRALEVTLGQTLFDRALRPPALTLAGSAVLQHAQGILEHARRLEQIGNGEGVQELPLLRMGMANTFAVTVAPLLLEQIRHLARSWTVSSGAGETRVEGLLERRLDLVITFDDAPVRRDLLCLPIMSEPFCLAVPRSFRGPVQHWADLRGAGDMLRYGRHLHLSGQVERHLSREGMDFPARFRLDTISAVIAMVAAGVGWSLVTPLSVLSSASLASRLRLLPMPGSELRRTLMVAGRPEDGGAIVPLVQKASIQALASNCLPELRRLLPEMSETIALAEPGASTIPEPPPRARRVRSRPSSS
jgi:DNA-binding transcriptional LysR family regulator